jgi:hypothetical protein
MTKSIFGKFRKLEKKKKLQLVIAVSISVVLLVALPVYAWFTHKRSIALTTKINAPTQLYITAGNKESVANLEMADIDVEDGNYKDFVSCCDIKLSRGIYFCCKSNRTFVSKPRINRQCHKQYHRDGYCYD